LRRYEKIKVKEKTIKNILVGRNIFNLVIFFSFWISKMVFAKEKITIIIGYI